MLFLQWSPHREGIIHLIRPPSIAGQSDSLAIPWLQLNSLPITLARQSAKRRRAPAVLTADELKALLAELTGAYRVMVCVACKTGLRISELLGLRWSDCNFDAGEIQLSCGIVRQHETEMKMEASRKACTDGKGLGRCADELANGVWLQPAIGPHLRSSGYGRLAAALAARLSFANKERQNKRIMAAASRDQTYEYLAPSAIERVPFSCVVQPAWTGFPF